jgi:hypothetical protein
MTISNDKPKRKRRLVAVDELPDDMRDHALVDWPTATRVCGLNDPEYCRQILTKAGVPMVQVSARRCLPTWGDLKAYLKSKSRTVAA